jgi:hypothetical protein
VGNKEMTKIIVDIEVVDGKIRASKPDDQSLRMPNTKRGIYDFYEVVEPPRFNNHVYGSLKGRAFNKARRIIDKYGSITNNRIYGSIEIFEKDFVPLVNKKE